MEQHQLNSLADMLDTIADGLPSTTVPLAEFGSILRDVLAAIVDLFGDEMAGEVRRPLAMGWSAAAAAIALRDPVATGGVRGNLAGIGPVELAGGSLLTLPALPAFVGSSAFSVGEWGEVVSLRLR